MKYCFEIKSSVGDIFTFCAKTNDELLSWMDEFKNYKINSQNNIEIKETKI